MWKGTEAVLKPKPTMIRAIPIMNMGVRENFPDMTKPAMSRMSRMPVVA